MRDRGKYIIRQAITEQERQDEAGMGGTWGNETVGHGGMRADSKFMQDRRDETRQSQTGSYKTGQGD